MFDGIFSKTHSNKTHRQTPCDVCGGIVIEIGVTNLELDDLSVDEVYEERCANCNNLLYGWVKKAKNSKIVILDKKKDAEVI